MNKKFVFLALLFATIMAVPAFPQDNQNPLQPGDILLSGGVGFGTFNPDLMDGGSGGFIRISSSITAFQIGVGLSADYVLPINFPLTVGLEIGFANATFDGKWSADKDTFNLVPIKARVAWHPYFGVRNLNTYVMLKTGVGLAFPKFAGEAGFGAGFGIGGNIGVRYFFTDHIGVFLEGGYETFFIKYDIDFPAENTWGDPAGKGHTMYSNTFATIGITYKF